MASPSIEQIRVRELDASGNEVLCVYAKKTPEYAVYRDPARVMIQFADNENHAQEQRISLAQLSALRGQISGLIDGWHGSKDRDNRSRAKRYDRRVADAIVTGFEGRIPDALALLAEIRDDIVAERKSIAQTDYLAVAALAGILFLVVIGVCGALGSIDDQPAHSSLIWAGAAGGVLGAFFSIATGLRSQSILIDLQRWDNRRDAILRMAVGTIAGGVLLSLLLTNMASLAHINRGSLTATGVGTDAIEPVLLAFILGFIGGFSERAVPSLLSSASLSVENTNDVAAKQARLAGAPLTSSSNAGHQPKPAAGVSGTSTDPKVSDDKGDPAKPKSRVSEALKAAKPDLAEQVAPKTAEDAGGATSEKTKLQTESAENAKNP